MELLDQPPTNNEYIANPKIPKINIMSKLFDTKEKSFIIIKVSAVLLE